MTLSRTARILVALLLLAAAAFFWVNFFTQSRVIGDDPETTPSAADTPTVTPPVATDADADVDAEAAADAPEGVEADADADADADDAETDAAEADAVETADADDADAAVVVVPGADAIVADADAVDDADDAAVVVAPDAVPAAPDASDPPVVVIDPPVTLARDVVVADLPFLVTEPPVAPVADEAAAVDPREAERALAAARATVNPFSPVVRPAPPAPAAAATAPDREVPGAPGVVTEVAIPAGPPAAPARIAAPAPRALAPAPSVNGSLPRALPSGTPLAATPTLLQEPRAIDTIDRATVPEITTARVPEEAIDDSVVDLRIAPLLLTDVPSVRGTEATAIGAAAAVGEAPLAAGTNRLARFLRDNGYSFTGSVLGPVSVGVFRSNGDPTPQVVALGQTLPNTEIVLTDLRGQQAELMLDDIRQILILDIRR